MVDEEMLRKVGRSPLVLVVETQNIKSGLGTRFGTWLLERGLAPKYAHFGTTREGNGGLEEQVPYQGLTFEAISQKVKALI